MSYPTTLAIDTSCDETSVSVVHGVKVLSNVLPSQMEYHSKYGGVVPNLARLAHQERIDNVVEESLKQSGVSMDQLDAIAVTFGPGLAIALEVGIKKAKELALEHKKPLIIVNHMEGHLLSGFAERNSETNDNSIMDVVLSDQLYPTLGLLVSGKHTEFILVKAHSEYEKIGETLDDSCGEAFDKAGRMLGLGYPGGPVISEFSKENRKNIKLEVIKNNKSTLVKGVNVESGEVYELPIAMANSGDLNFSYSGLKTAFRQLIDGLSKKEVSTEMTKLEQDNQISKGLTKQQILDLAVMFEEAAFKPIEIKLKQALNQHNVKEVWLGGGVVASARLKQVVRKIVKNHDENINLRVPFGDNLTKDNAAMIGIAANFKLLKYGDYKNIESDDQELGILVSKSEIEKIDRDPSLEF